MPTFQYQARTQEGEARTGVIEAPSQEAALDVLQQNELMIISVHEKTGGGVLEFKLGEWVRQKDLVIFSRQLSILFEARIPVVEALRTLIGEAAKTSLKKIISEVLDDVAGGMSLSQAMGRHPRFFSPFYIHLVRSGEESGKLQEVFTYLADYLERSYYIISKTRNAMIYPAFVLLAFVGVIIVLLVAVIPRLVSIFEETGQAVPFYTQAIIMSSNFLRSWGIFLLLIVVAGAIGFWRWIATANGKAIVDKLQLNTPLVGDLYKKFYMARLTDNLRTLIISGIPIIRALTITGDVVGNTVYKRATDEAIEAVKRGDTISTAFQKFPEIPVLVTQMIRIGEASGRLDFILGNIAKFYAREVDSLVENLISLIEPALIIFLGAGVGILVAAVLVPMYNLVGSI